MNIINFEKYFYTWLEGISNEIKFWDNLFESKGKEEEILRYLSIE